MANRAQRRMPIRTAQVDFTEDGYPGFRATMRTNPPMSVALDFQSEDMGRIFGAVRVCYPAWDFVDEEGEAIPHDERGTGMIPPDLLNAMISRWGEVLKATAAIPKANGASSSPTSPPEPEARIEASPEVTRA